MQSREFYSDDKIRIAALAKLEDRIHVIKSRELVAAEVHYHKWC